jgi:hypothetical protein
MRPGRPVRWTFEVSADVPAKGAAKARKPAKTRQRSRALPKKARAGKPPVEKARVEKAPVEKAPVERLRTEKPPAVTPPPAQRTTPLRAGLVIAAVVLVIAAAAFPHRPATTGAVAVAPSAPPIPSSITPPIAAPSAPSALIAAAPAPTIAPAVKLPVVTPRVKRELSKGSSTKPVAAVAPAAAVTKEDEPVTKPTPSEPLVPAAPASTESTAPGLVTITGCLEVSTGGDEFRLADIEGDSAPKSRSWRTGFFKKRATPVTLIEPPDVPALKSNVGHRVAATGRLDGRDLRVNSLRAVGASCN